MRTLHVQVDVLIQRLGVMTNVVFFNLCNKNWEVVRITRNGWNVEPIEHNYKQVLFKRFSINNPQVYPNKDYPSDIMDQFIKLTNVHGNENNRLLVEVYLVSLFLLTGDSTKAYAIPHGLHGSGKSTFHEFIKLVVDPAVPLTTAFPKEYRRVGSSPISQLPHLL